MNFDLLFRNTGKSAAISTTSLGSELIITPLEVFSDSTHINYCNKDNAADFTSVGTIILPGGRSNTTLTALSHERTSNLIQADWSPHGSVYASKMEKKDAIDLIF
jgi:hypothetical protein